MADHCGKGKWWAKYFEQVVNVEEDRDANINLVKNNTYEDACVERIK